MVRLTFAGELKDITGVAEDTAQAGDIRGVLAHIASRYGSKAKKTALRCLVAVDGVRASDPRQKLKDGCTVSFSPLCSGG